MSWCTRSPSASRGERDGHDGRVRARVARRERVRHVARDQARVAGVHGLALALAADRAVEVDGADEESELREQVALVHAHERVHRLVVGHVHELLDELRLERREPGKKKEEKEEEKER